MEKKSFKNFLLLIVKNIWVKQLLLAFIAVIVLCTIVLFGLDLYTRHGETVENPSLHGLTIEEAHKVLTQAGLRAEVIDSVYFKESLPNTIVEQLPRAGAKVKPNRLIFLTVNSGSRRMIAFPELRESSLRQAQSTLQSMGFTVAAVVEGYSPYKDVVIDLTWKGRSLQPGTKVPDGAAITIIVGNGLGEEPPADSTLLETESSTSTELIIQ